MVTEKIIEFILWLLIAASIIAVVTNRYKIPYTVALVLGGLAIDFFELEIMEGFHFSPEIVLIIFLPALLFEAGMNINIQQLRRNLIPILSLAIIGVLISTFITGFAIAELGEIAILPALTFAALITATDPVSVIAILKELGVSKRLTVLLEGESLLNDGTAVVLFLIFKEAVISTGEVEVMAGIGRFIAMSLGGAALGLLFGYVAGRVTRYVEDARIEITLTTILAYMSYLVAEHLHISGVIATVAAGLMVGNYGSRIGMSARTRVALWGFWEYLVFVINSLVFLLIGLEVKIHDLVENWWMILVGIGITLVSRGVAVYSLVPAANLMAKPISLRWRHVLLWGGLHGTVSLALALTLPQDFPFREKILAMTFGVVLFSLVVQGLTIKGLLNLLNVKPDKEDAYDRIKVSQIAASRSLDELQAMYDRNEISYPIFNKIQAELEQRVNKIKQELQEIYENRPELAEEEISLTKIRIISAEKSAITRAMADGLISYHTGEELLDKADKRLDDLGAHS